MVWPRKLRLLVLVFIALARKYTRFLTLGFLSGLVISLVFWKTMPFISSRGLASMERVGIVGEFTPTTLPLAIQQRISEGLTSLATNGEPQPALAVAWEATNSGKTFVFHLRDDARWHNGKLVEAKDINYNIRGVVFIPQEPTTLTAHLQYPYSPFPSLVAKPIFLPGLRGVGKYRVSGINLQGDSVRSLRLYPTTRDAGKPYEYRFYRTEAQAFLAFQLGEVDVLEDVSSVGPLASWGKISVEESVRYNRMVSLYFNLKDPLLAQKPLRQALAYAVPELPYEPALSPIGKTSWSFNDRVRNYIYDLAQAKKLLSSAKLATESSSLTISTFSPYLEVTQTIANSWSAFGVRTNVKVENAISRDFQILLSASDLPPDPDQYPLWHSTQTQTNLTGYANVKIDKLLEDGRQELDPAKREKIYEDFQRRLVEDAPAVFLYYPTTYTIRRGK